MPDALATYRKKRDFGITSEPRGKTGRSGKQLAFVVQKHAATRLHYDFRLELEGTLKSWAVPKGPSLDPAAKRMAVHVEDHPLAYGGFEGEIPPKQYGAGHVIVWDRGTWEPVGDPVKGYEAGKLKFVLHGEKLQGGWTLVRMHGREGERQEPWLLIKERDAAARPEAEYSITESLPNSVITGAGLPEKTPARAAAVRIATKAVAKTTMDTAAKAAAGTAAQTAAGTAAKTAARTAAKVVAPTASRAAAKPSAKTARGSGTRSPAARSSGTDDDGDVPAGAVAGALPERLEPELATLVAGPPDDDSAWGYEIKFDGYRILARIDGADVRLVTRNGNDWTDRLPAIAAELRAMRLPPCWLDGEIVVLNAQGVSDFGALQRAFEAGGEAIRYFVFDLPFAAGYDLRGATLEARRERLAALLGNGGERVRFSDAFHAGADEILAQACRLHLEGVIGKRLGSPYRAGRTRDWIKLKCTLRQEFVIGGYTEPRGARTGLGALLLGIHDGGKLRYAGSVGTGFDARTLADLKRRLVPLETERSPFDDKPRGLKGRWVRPELVAEASFAEWTKDGKVRQAVFHGLRSDKPPAAISREEPQPAPKAHGGRGGARTQDRTAAAPAPAPADPPALESPVRITHPERVIDPKSGATKRDLIDWYLHAARRMLPHLAGRPVALVRAPAGIGGHLFFQKHAGTLRIEDIHELPEDLDPGHPPLLEIDSFTALISAAQMNVVEFHTWNANAAHIEKPDRVTFDLDPGEGVAWRTMQDAARLVRRVLEDELGLAAFLKTSGGKGLHIVVPLVPKDSWDAVKDFSRAVVERLAALAPDAIVAKSGPKNRVGRIFVDYLRNTRGATTAAAFSARARPGLGVSIPCAWDELGAIGSGDHWTVLTGHERLEAGADPWSGYPAAARTLAAARKALRSAAVV